MIQYGRSKAGPLIPTVTRDKEIRESVIVNVGRDDAVAACSARHTRLDGHI